MSSRRSFCLAVATAFAGCIGGPRGRKSNRTDSPTGAASPDATETPTTSNTPDGTATSSETPEGMWNLGDFVLWNQHDTDHDLTVHVERDGDVLMTETRTLAGGSSRRVENPISEPGTYRVSGTLSSGEPTTYEWSLQCQGNAEYLQVVVTEDVGVEIRQKHQTVTSPPC